GRDRTGREAQDPEGHHHRSESGPGREPLLRQQDRAADADGYRLSRQAAEASRELRGLIRASRARRRSSAAARRSWAETSAAFLSAIAPREMRTPAPPVRPPTSPPDRRSRLLRGEVSWQAFASRWD